MCLWLVSGCSSDPMGPAAPDTPAALDATEFSTPANLLAPNRVCILLDDDWSGQATAILASHGLSVVREYGAGRLVLGEGEPDPDALAEDNRIKAYQVDGFTVLSEPVELTMSYYEGFWEEGLATQDALAALRLDLVHQRATGEGVRVAVLDTGVDPDHELLGPRIDLPPAGPGSLGSIDVAQGVDTDLDGIVAEAFGHGTHVAGITATMAPGATIIPIRVLDSDGVGSAFELAMGLYEAAEAGAHVANLSLVLEGESEVVEFVIEEISDAGVFVVGAAGNVPGKAWFPATEDHVFGVAAVDGARGLAPFSASHGASIAAPGVSVRSAYPNGRSAIASGTSMASAVAAGAVAILTQLTGSAETSGDTLRATARRREGSGFSRGELDLHTAVHSLAQPRSMTRVQFSESH
jgi:subtilisin family serine protease